MKNKPKNYHCKKWVDVADRIAIFYPRLKAASLERRTTKLEKKMLEEYMDDLYQMAEIADLASKAFDISELHQINEN